MHEDNRALVADRVSGSSASRFRAVGMAELGVSIALRLVQSLREHNALVKVTRQRARISYRWLIVIEEGLRELVGTPGLSPQRLDRIIELLKELRSVVDELRTISVFQHVMKAKRLTARVDDLLAEIYGHVAAMLVRAAIDSGKRASSKDNGNDKDKDKGKDKPSKGKSPKRSKSPKPRPSTAPVTITEAEKRALEEEDAFVSSLDGLDEPTLMKKVEEREAARTNAELLQQVAELHRCLDAALGAKEELEDRVAAIKLALGVRMDEPPPSYIDVVPGRVVQEDRDGDDDDDDKPSKTQSSKQETIPQWRRVCVPWSKLEYWRNSKLPDKTPVRQLRDGTANSLSNAQVDFLRSNGYRTLGDLRKKSRDQMIMERIICPCIPKAVLDVWLDERWLIPANTRLFPVRDSDGFPTPQLPQWRDEYQQTFRQMGIGTVSQLRQLPSHVLALLMCP